jgi:FkbM family methyltransferase
VRVEEGESIYTFQTLWGAPLHAFFRSGTSDFNTHLSSITEDEYELGRLPRHNASAYPLVAVDIGAHIGSESLALQSLGYYVVSVEPLPENQVLYCKNMELNKFTKWSLTPAALTATPGTVPVWYGPEELDEGHRFIGVTNYPGRGVARTVDCVTLADLLSPYPRVSFMKVDIEGAEWSAFNTRESIDSMTRVERLAIELGGVSGRGVVSTSDFLALLPDTFRDVSSEYFPRWCAPSGQVHGYYVNEDLL